jgi:hypothetical protein
LSASSEKPNQPARSLVDSLADAATAATTGSTTEPAVREPEPAPKPASTTPAARVHSSETITPYVADVPLHLDPETLNDPFTSKLLNALHTEEPLTESLTQPVQIHPDDAWEDTRPTPAMTHEQATLAMAEYDQRQTIPKAIFPQPSAAPAHEPIPIDQRETVPSSAAAKGRMRTPQELADTLEKMPVHGLTSAPESAPADTQPDGIDEQDQDEDDDDEPSAIIPSRFTAEELHDLFRNRYPKDEAGGGAEQPAKPAPAAKSPETSQPTKKFVGANKPSSAEPLPTVARAFPPEIRKACRLLGLIPEDLTRPVVLEAWKKEMAKPGVHPDTGGDTEMAIYLNTAKDTLMRWVDDQTPKLGKKFGGKSAEHPPKSQPKQE